MMRNLLLTLILLSIALTLPVRAQSTEESAPADAEGSAVTGQRPEMPNLFFRREQRLILEAVRQGIVEQEDFDIEEFVPVVILQDVLPLFEEEQERARIVREDNVYFDAYILNRQTGQGLVWINGVSVDPAKESGYLSRIGINIQGEEGEEQLPYGVEQGVLSGGDSFNESQFKVRIGQTINTDGSVEETFPVVLRKN